MKPLLNRMSVSLLAATFTFAPAAASPAEYGSRDEAIAMLQRAISEMTVNPSDAIAKFNHNDRKFRDRDLFVFCFDDKGRLTAHEALVGRDIRTLRDAAGKLFGEAMYEQATDAQIKEVTFLSSVPGSTELATKEAFIARVGGQVCGVSAYKLDGAGGPMQ